MKWGLEYGRDVGSSGGKARRSRNTRSHVPYFIIPSLNSNLTRDSPPTTVPLHKKTPPAPYPNGPETKEKPL